MTKEEENTTECLAWIDANASTMSAKDTAFCRQEVAKGGVYVAYGILCRYEYDGGDGPGVSQLGG